MSLRYLVLWKEPALSSKVYVTLFDFISSSKIDGMLALSSTSLIMMKESVFFRRYLTLALTFLALSELSTLMGMMNVVFKLSPNFQRKDLPCLEDLENRTNSSVQ
jgi:hypothetical protein